MTEVIKKILYKGVVPVVGGIMVACMAIANDTESKAYMRELARGRAMTDHYSNSLSNSPTAEPESRDPDEQLGNFVEAVQELMRYGWNVASLTTDGIVRVEGESVVWECGFLDPTPDDANDNDFIQYSDVKSISAKLNVALPEKTLVIWEGKMGYTSNGGAEKVDTESMVLACPKVAVVGK